jgi:hypothetical protein
MFLLGLSNGDSLIPLGRVKPLCQLFSEILHRLLGIRLEHWRFRLSTEDAGCGGVGLGSKKTKDIVGSVTVGFLFLSTLLEEDRIQFAIPSRPTSLLHILKGLSTQNAKKADNSIKGAAWDSGRLPYGSKTMFTWLLPIAMNFPNPWNKLEVPKRHSVPPRVDSISLGWRAISLARNTCTYKSMRIKPRPYR